MPFSTAHTRSTISNNDIDSSPPPSSHNTAQLSLLASAISQQPSMVVLTLTLFSSPFSFLKLLTLAWASVFCAALLSPIVWTSFIKKALVVYFQTLHTHSRLIQLYKSRFLASAKAATVSPPALISSSTATGTIKAEPMYQSPPETPFNTLEPASTSCSSAATSSSTSVKAPAQVFDATFSTFLLVSLTKLAPPPSLHPASLTPLDLALSLPDASLLMTRTLSLNNVKPPRRKMMVIKPKTTGSEGGGAGATTISVVGLSVSLQALDLGGPPLHPRSKSIPHPVHRLRQPHSPSSIPKPKIILSRTNTGPTPRPTFKLAPTPPSSPTLSDPTPTPPSPAEPTVFLARCSRPRGKHAAAHYSLFRPMKLTIHSRDGPYLGLVLKECHGKKGRKTRMPTPEEVLSGRKEARWKREGSKLKTCIWSARTNESRSRGRERDSSCPELDSCSSSSSDEQDDSNLDELLSQYPIILPSLPARRKFGDTPLFRQNPIGLGRAPNALGNAAGLVGRSVQSGIEVSRKSGVQAICAF